QIFIKDVKISNGTSINSELLSPEGLGSERYKLKSDDTRSTRSSLKTPFSSYSVSNSELTSSAKMKILTINRHEVKSPPASYAYFPNKIS
ncbi:hypothetical protein PILCRDRAFT_81211, partial [Piloderma croceum F 1598]